ncbi:LysR family transcriptional regulator [Lactiplantibacillus garii]|uniref:LysR family transcriptional regulator n=1 Tax=Lactiplantibacillus garii TaxID=2306423 RepID=A0A426D506_9LACO|nr:LysR family transcriptional regulator [Lactiplantibacillus garii]RRK09696.1 LysR family transcriptional regulator [Lactiplantibacillus garii]
MNERDLKYFCYLVETGNYTETAEHFRVTQPAISAALKRLETDYAITLLTQRNHRAKLETTPAGRVLYVKATHLIKELAQVELEVQHANETQVRLGFSNVAGGIWLPRVIKRFIKYQLLDQVTTTVADSEPLLTQLRDGKLDAAVFSTLVPEKSSDLRVTTLEEHALSFLVNVNNPLSRLATLHVADLKDVPIVARPKHALPRTALERLCRQGRVRPNIIYEAPTNALVEGLVAQNVGVGLVIKDSVVLRDQVVSVPLAPREQLDCYMQLAVRRSFLPNAQQQRCIELLKDVRRR